MTMNRFPIESKMAVNITVVGDGFVGKTSMLFRFTEDKSPENYVPTIFDNYSGKLTVDGVEYKLQLRDTSGQEDYERIRKLSYFNVDCFVICFAVNSPDSLRNVKNVWIKELKRARENKATLLVGTKSDLREYHENNCVKEVDAIEIKNKIKAYDYVECSSITRQGINEVFENAIRAILHSQKSEKHYCRIL